MGLGHFRHLYEQAIYRDCRAALIGTSLGLVWQDAPVSHCMQSARAIVAISDDFEEEMVALASEGRVCMRRKLKLPGNYVTTEIINDPEYIRFNGLRASAVEDFHTWLTTYPNLD